MEIGWEKPRYATFLHRLARGRRLIIFDRRGMGCLIRLRQQARRIACSGRSTAALRPKYDARGGRAILRHLGYAQSARDLIRRSAQDYGLNCGATPTGWAVRC